MSEHKRFIQHDAGLSRLRRYMRTQARKQIEVLARTA